ncbi:MAG: hypothetical protein O9350_18925 [Microcystis sp. LE19-388.1G]|jgi:hypothetical protein|nr:hypothetical protein [Microcystis sp. LE19-388.1G]
MIKDVILGIIFLLAGLTMIISTYKKPEKLFWSLNIQGYLGGVCLIIVGIVFIFIK